MLLKKLIVVVVSVGTALFLEKKMKEKEEKPTGREQAFREAEEEILKRKNEPDRPQPFGKDVAWYVVKSKNPEEVLVKLNLFDTEPANWRAGIYFAMKERNNQVFVSPPVDGWVFIVSRHLSMSIFPQPVPQSFKEAVEQFSQFFTEAQFFQSYSWREQFYSWMRAKEGTLLRSYFTESYSLPTKVVEDLGELTQIENRIFHFNGQFMGKEQLEFSNFGETLLTIAGDWSIDPRKLGVLFFEKGIGYLGKYPHG